jgi:DNA-binding MarR family transcriptional regulator
MSRDLPELTSALRDLAALLNSRKFHTALVKETGISLDRALIRLVHRIDEQKNIGIEALSELIGRDQSTISRQFAKLERLGLATRVANQSDKRAFAAALTAKGKAIANTVNRVRNRLSGPAFDGWSQRDRAEFLRLVRKFVVDIDAYLSTQDAEKPTQRQRSRGSHGS